MAEARLKKQDLKDWLKHHNRIVAAKHNKMDEYQMYDTLALEGLKQEQYPEEKLEELINVPISQLDANGTMLPLKKTSKPAHAVIEKILRSDKNRARFDAGLNPATLLSENRRKLILRTLASEVEADDGSSISGKSIDDAINMDTPGRGKDLYVPGVSQSLASASIVSVSGTSTTESLAKLGVDPRTRQFQPKWEHYNTMRSRWKYVQPQVKHLVSDKEAFAPVTVQNFIQVGKRTLTGNVNDINSFLKSEQRKLDRGRRVLNESVVLRAEKAERDARCYVPLHAVRWRGADGSSISQDHHGAGGEGGGASHAH